MFFGWFLFLRLILASHYGSIISAGSRSPSRETSYQNSPSPLRLVFSDLPVTKQIDNLSKCMLVVGGANMALTTALQIFPRQLCPDTSSVFRLIAIAFPISMTLVWELALGGIIAQTAWSDRERPYGPSFLRNSLKGLSIAIILLVSVKIVGILVPVEGYSGILDEICSWRGSTLFDSLKWVLTQTLPSFLVPLFAVLMIWLNENIHDHNKYEQ